MLSSALSVPTKLSQIFTLVFFAKPLTNLMEHDIIIFALRDHSLVAGTYGCDFSEKQGRMAQLVAPWNRNYNQSKVAWLSW